MREGSLVFTENKDEAILNSKFLGYKISFIKDHGGREIMEAMDHGHVTFASFRSHDSLRQQ